MSSLLRNSLLGYFKLHFFDLWRELALKQRKGYIKNGKSCFVILKLSYL